MKYGLRVTFKQKFTGEILTYYLAPQNDDSEFIVTTLLNGVYMYKILIIEPNQYKTEHYLYKSHYEIERIMMVRLWLNNQPQLIYNALMNYNVWGLSGCPINFHRGICEEGKMKYLKSHHTYHQWISGMIILNGQRKGNNWNYYDVGNKKTLSGIW